MLIFNVALHFQTELGKAKLDGGSDRSTATRGIFGSCRLSNVTTIYTITNLYGFNLKLLINQDVPDIKRKQGQTNLRAWCQNLFFSKFWPHGLLFPITVMHYTVIQLID